MTWLGFAIDVGGTFTDTLGLRVDGSVRFDKRLSSGLWPSRIGEVMPSCILDGRLMEFPDGFWDGATFKALSSEGKPLGKPVLVKRHEARAGLLHLVAPPPAGTMAHGRYVLQSDEEAPISALRFLQGLSRHDSLPAHPVRLGTTRGTNALLMRAGARTALCITRGFGDLGVIRRQDRPDLFALDIHRLPPLHHHVVEIDERLDADGGVLAPLDEAAAYRRLRELRPEGVQAVAICLMHGHRFPHHEERLARMARELGFRTVRLSSVVAPVPHLVRRMETTVLDASLFGVVSGYLERVQQSLGAAALSVMQSDGGLARASHYAARDSVLSGPAGGARGVLALAEAEDCLPALGFDMGGTSTDVSRTDGTLPLVHEREVAGVTLAAPALAIHTVAAGGGSICAFDGACLKVGPESAASDPGPACHGAGGPLTLTDVNLLLGMIDEGSFPVPLDRDAAELALHAVAEAMRAAGMAPHSPEHLAQGFRRVANEHMAQALREVSVHEGFHPGEHTLVAFGGAGPQHAADLARLLGIRAVLVPPRAGGFSAWGLSRTPLSVHERSPVELPAEDEHREYLAARFHAMEEAARSRLAEQGAPPGLVTLARHLECRYRGQERTLVVDPGDDGLGRASFPVEHGRRFGHRHELGIEIVALLVEAEALPEVLPEVAAPPEADSSRPRPDAVRQAAPMFCSDSWEQATRVDRGLLTEDAELRGPALITGDYAPIVVPPGFTARKTARGAIRLRETEPVPPALPSVDGARDPVFLEVFLRRMQSIAQQMGSRLEHCAFSANIKDRRDFSCAIFDAEGELVAHAPHIPVHLGAMDLSVQALLNCGDALASGDVFISNDPTEGGSHLPDITVMTPVFDETGRRRFFAACRAHHADVGGVEPGSLPARSTRLDQEGVRLRRLRWVRAGNADDDALRAALAAGPHPCRRVEENLADLRAQWAAVRHGAQRLEAALQLWDAPRCARYAAHLQDIAAEHAARAFRRLGDGVYEAADAMDEGLIIKVRIRLKEGHAHVDFAGTSPASEASNLNAPLSVTRAAVLYAVRCLIDRPLPLNGGLWRAITLSVPAGSLLDPPEHAAVVGGNVETGQRLVDVLLAALGLCANSQGTMNNVTFGAEGESAWSHYETIAGGAGAGPGFAGASGVHTHLTNTRATDPEVLEQRFPVLLRRFSLRPGSGGRGAHRGGDGVVREYEFRAEARLSLLTERRERSPRGREGGEDGAPGRNLLVRAGQGEPEPLAGHARATVRAGDRLIIETPGGGGWGAPPPEMKALDGGDTPRFEPRR